jgi:hypothetical protein
VQTLRVLSCWVVKMLEDLSIPSKASRCKVDGVKKSLSDKDAKILEDSVMNPEWPLLVLSRELKKRNINISDNSLRRHRLKDCSCWKI